MFEFLKTAFKVRTKAQDIEAKLRPVPGCNYQGHGEVEFEAWQEGMANIELELKLTNVPAGKVIEVVAEDVYLGDIQVTNERRHKVRIKYESYETWPQLEIGQTVEMIIDGQVCFSGVFHKD